MSAFIKQTTHTDCTAESLEKHKLNVDSSILHSDDWWWWRFYYCVSHTNMFSLQIPQINSSSRLQCIHFFMMLLKVRKSFNFFIISGFCHFMKYWHSVVCATQNKRRLHFYLFYLFSMWISSNLPALITTWGIQDINFATKDIWKWFCF